MADHTPTPWCIPDGEDNESLVCQQIDGRCGIIIFGTADKFRSWQRRIEYAEQNANAAFIVKAVNSHDALVEALRTIADIAEGSGTVNSLPNIAKIARAALETIKEPT